MQHTKTKLSIDYFLQQMAGSFRIHRYVPLRDPEEAFDVLAETLQNLAVPRLLHVSRVLGWLLGHPPLVANATEHVQRRGWARWYLCV